jgi:SAM-dependent methyltransferase
MLFTPGRRYLEKVLMPATCPPDGTRVVLAGIHPYTTHYSYFYAGHRVFAFDPDPRMAAYRGRATFFPRPLRELGKGIEPGTAALIHCNGVYGWGLDDQRELEESLDSVYEALAPGGVLLFGYNLKNNNPLGWHEATALPQRRLVELRTPEYPVCLGHNQVFRVFRKPN